MKEGEGDGERVKKKQKLWLVAKSECLNQSVKLVEGKFAQETVNLPTTKRVLSFGVVGFQLSVQCNEIISSCGFLLCFQVWQQCE